MSGTTLNQSSDGELMGNLQAIATSIFARHGVGFATARRGGGWTNAVWLTDGLALRLSTTKENESLLREVQLAAFFPPEVGYPELLETGTTDGFAWTLATRLPGKSLGETWDDLNWRERTTALRGLWVRAQAVHTVPVSAVNVSRQTWFNSTNAEEAEASLVRLTKDGIFSASENSVLRDALDRFWSTVSTAPCVLCHGDLTLDNAMWHAGQLSALLDFEFAVQAPVQLDLNHLVRCAFGPEDTAHPSTAAKHQGMQQLRQAVAELAGPLLAQPGDRNLLMGYAILLPLCHLELWLANPEGEGCIEQWDPLRRLRSLADGTGGYLASLLSD